MKTRILLAAIALGIVGTTSAATLSNAEGQSCGTQLGLWHFVNNQTTPDAPAGTLSAEFEDGAGCLNIEPSKVTQRTQHFYCISAGTLLRATTTLDGRLVLSDFTCGVEPPKCDPYKDPNCKEEPPKCDPNTDKNCTY